MKRLISDFGDGGAMYILHQHWEEAVGAVIAEHCKPRRIVDGSILIDVDHPGWATEIQYLERDLLQKLTRIDPKLQFEGIKVHVKGSQES
jgi:predicted nucleic acid-binding Zn ribbon protein